MSALQRLADLLRPSAGTGARPMPIDTSIDKVIVRLERHANAGSSTSVPEDLQAQAVRRFWDDQRFENLKDARLVSFGMCLPSRPAGPCIMEDRQRFQAVLDDRDGVGQWLDDPRWFRRCYQGLVRSYFTYDAYSEKVSAIGRQNWGDLRDYLNERTRNIVDKAHNPQWVTTAVGNRQLYGDDPCAPYASAVLEGDTSAIDHLCEQLGVIKASWFLRELVLAQVRHATKLSHERFKEYISNLVKLIENNLILRDRCLIFMLDKYASVAQPALDEELRNAAVDWWGNPWLPSNEMRWGGVTPKAREMVAEWLKREFIEAFFTKLAEDGVGDRRRANFWLRYVKSMGNVQFALGAKALYSRDRDFVVLRQKMKGLYTELRTTTSSNNAFVMTLGSLVVVEFGGMGNALYGYDDRNMLPFDMSKPVMTTVNGRNSLKHSQKLLWMQHQDGIKGWNKWEEMFEATLRRSFDIKPNVVPQRVSSSTAVSQPDAKPSQFSGSDRILTTAQASLGNSTASVTDRFSMASLASLARARDLVVDDRTDQNGNLWIRTGDNDRYVNKVLLDWKFTYKPGKGWWR